MKKIWSFLLCISIVLTNVVLVRAAEETQEYTQDVAVTNVNLYHKYAEVTLKAKTQEMCSATVNVIAENQEGTVLGQNKYTFENADGKVTLTFSDMAQVEDEVSVYVKCSDGQESEHYIRTKTKCERSWNTLVEDRFQLGTKGFRGYCTRAKEPGTVTLTISGNTYQADISEDGTFQCCFDTEYAIGLEAEYTISCVAGCEIGSGSVNVDNELGIYDEFSSNASSKLHIYPNYAYCKDYNTATDNVRIVFQNEEETTFSSSETTVYCESAHGSFIPFENEFTVGETIRFWCEDPITGKVGGVYSTTVVSPFSLYDFTDTYSAPKSGDTKVSLKGTAADSVSFMAPLTGRISVNDTEYTGTEVKTVGWDCVSDVTVPSLQEGDKIKAWVTDEYGDISNIVEYQIPAAENKVSNDNKTDENKMADENKTDNNKTEEITDRTTTKKNLILKINKSVSVSQYITGSKENIKWSSSNKKIAKVNTKGKVTALYLGTVTITAKFTDTNQKLSWNVIVNRETTTEVTAKDKVKLKDWTKYVGVGAGKWKSSNTKVASLSGGTLIAKKKGTTVLSCKYKGIVYKLTVKVQKYIKPKYVKPLTKKEKKEYKKRAFAYIWLSSRYPKTVNILNCEFDGRKLIVVYTNCNILGNSYRHELIIYKSSGKFRYSQLY
jgi:hypothetical protein